MSENVQANFNNLVDQKEVKFSFKKDELGNKRPTIEVKLAVPSVEGIVAILQSGDQKQLDLLLSAVADVVVAQGRSIVSDNENITADNFPFDQCTWEAIANLPESEKRGRGIAKELWEAFAVDYIQVMQAAAGKTKEQVELAAKLLVTKFQSVKTQKPIIRKLVEQLTIYTNASANAETFVDCIKFLNEKAESLMQADEAAMLANL